jgi:hypothetical protein
MTKPDVPEITADDWEDTPLSVKAYVRQLESKLK